MLKYHNPEAAVGVDESPYELSLDITSGDEKNIGLLANGFPDSVEFLGEVGTALKRLFPNVNIHVYNKGNASIPAGAQLLGEIGGECVGVVAAYGH